MTVTTALDVTIRRSGQAMRRVPITAIRRQGMLQILGMNRATVHATICETIHTKLCLAMRARTDGRTCRQVTRAATATADTRDRSAIRTRPAGTHNLSPDPPSGMERGTTNRGIGAIHANIAADATTVMTVTVAMNMCDTTVEIHGVPSNSGLNGTCRPVKPGRRAPNTARLLPIIAAAATATMFPETPIPRRRTTVKPTNGDSMAAIVRIRGGVRAAAVGKPSGRRVQCKGS